MVVHELFGAGDESSRFLEVGEVLRQKGRHSGGDYPSHAQTLLCGTYGEQRGGFEVGAGDAGALGYFDDTGLCTDGAEADAGSLCEGTSARVDIHNKDVPRQ